jgi:hypothetical protein
MNEANKEPFPNRDRESVGLAGEYAVASELCKRGLYAQLTLGAHKKTDILVEQGDKRLFRVSVKAKTGPSWRNVTGIWADGDLIIFVDYKDKSLTERPDFYILNVKQWVATVKRIRKKKDKQCKFDKATNTLYWDPWNGNKGWRGCSVVVGDVSSFKDSWPIIHDESNR